MLIIFAILWTVFIITSPIVFLSEEVYHSLMSVIPFTGIMALSLTFVIICREFDLSFPSVMGFCTWVFSIIFQLTGNAALAMLGCLIMGAIAGFLNGILVVKVGIPSIVATIGTMFFWRGVIMVVTGGWGSTLPLKGTVFYNVLVGRIGFIPAQMLWFIVLTFVFWSTLNRHKFGAHVYYTGDNIETAKLMGVNVDKVRILAFTQMGVFAAFAGMLATLEVTYYWPTLGEGYLLRTMAAVFIGGTGPFGGTGTILGTFIGSLIIGSLETGVLAMGFSGFWTQLVSGIVMILAIAFHAFLRGKPA